MNLLQRSDQLKFRLHGSSKKAKIVKGNVLASNGIIHIINKLLTNAPDNYGSEQVRVRLPMRKNLQTFCVA